MDVLIKNMIIWMKKSINLKLHKLIKLLIYLQNNVIVNKKYDYLNEEINKPETS